MMDTQEKDGWDESGADEKTRVRSTQTAKDEKSTLIKSLRPSKITKRMMSGEKRKVCRANSGSSSQGSAGSDGNRFHQDSHRSSS